MWFKLTVILLALIFGTLWLAGQPDPSDPDRSVATAPDPAPEIAPEEEDAADPAPETAPRAAFRDLTPEPPAPPAAPPERAQTGAAATAEAEVDPEADAAPLSALTLEALRIPESGASAVSLADRVRARTGGQAVDTARPSRAPPPQTEVVVDTGGAPAPGSLGLGGGTAGIRGAAGSGFDPGTRVAVVTGTNVNLRAGPSTGNAVVGQVQAGQRVRLIGETQPGWSAIMNPETGEPVYMSSRFLSVASQ